MKKLKKGQCSIDASVVVTTTYDTGKVRHGKFEREIEGVLSGAFIEHIKGLCADLDGAADFEWKSVGKRTIELVKKDKP